MPAFPAPAMGFGLPQDSSAGCSGVSHLRDPPPILSVLSSVFPSHLSLYLVHLLD